LIFIPLNSFSSLTLELACTSLSSPNFTQHHKSLRSSFTTKNSSTTMVFVAYINKIFQRCERHSLQPNNMHIWTDGRLARDPYYMVYIQHPVRIYYYNIFAVYSEHCIQSVCPVSHNFFFTTVIYYALIVIGPRVRIYWCVIFPRVVFIHFCRWPIRLRYPLYIMLKVPESRVICSRRADVLQQSCGLHDAGCIMS